MSNIIHRDNYRIDEYSQRILSALADGDKTVSQLRDESGLDEWESADYRLREHLIPGNWVKQVGESPKTMSLTPEGKELVDSEGFDTPTLSEIRETALEASETAHSARESADKFRKQLYQVRQRLDRVNELKRSVDSLRTDFEAMREPHRPNKSDDGWRIFEVESRVWDLEQQLGKVDTIEELHDRVANIEEQLTLDDTRERLTDLDKRHNTTRKKVQELASAHNGQVDKRKESRKELETRLTEQEQRIEELERQLRKEQETSLLSRLWPF